MNGAPVMSRNRQTGFTLIELLIAIVIVAILAAVAYPAYLEQVRSARRADAQQALLSLAAAMERYHSQNLSYAGAADKKGVPQIFADEAPLDGDAKYYDLRVTSASVDDYTIQAQPKNHQADDGVLQLEADGTRRWDRDDDGSFGTDENCWKRTC
ncbi:general secretion pathway protein H [Salinisphaera sp. PC39]